MNATLSQLSWDFSTLYLIKTLSITASSDASSDGRYNVSFNGKALLASLETNYMNLVPKSCDEKSLSKPLQKEALRRKYSFYLNKRTEYKNGTQIVNEWSSNFSYSSTYEWIHLLMEDQIPLKYGFPQILWKTEFHRVCGKCTFHQFIYNNSRK